jgi:hypothetical protein
MTFPSGGYTMEPKVKVQLQDEPASAFWSVSMQGVTDKQLRSQKISRAKAQPNEETMV